MTNVDASVESPAGVLVLDPTRAQEIRLWHEQAMDAAAAAVAAEIRRPPGWEQESVRQREAAWQWAQRPLAYMTDLLAAEEYQSLGVLARSAAACGIAAGQLDGALRITAAAFMEQVPWELRRELYAEQQRIARWLPASWLPPAQTMPRWPTPAPRKKVAWTEVAPADEEGVRWELDASWCWPGVEVFLEPARPRREVRRDWWWIGYRNLANGRVWYLRNSRQPGRRGRVACTLAHARRMAEDHARSWYALGRLGCWEEPVVRCPPCDQLTVHWIISQTCRKRQAIPVGGVCLFLHDGWHTCWAPGDRPALRCSHCGYSQDVRTKP